MRPGFSKPCGVFLVRVSSARAEFYHDDAVLEFRSPGERFGSATFTRGRRIPPIPHRCASYRGSRPSDLAVVELRELRRPLGLQVSRCWSSEAKWRASDLWHGLREAPEGGRLGAGDTGRSPGDSIQW